MTSTFLVPTVADERHSAQEMQTFEASAIAAVFHASVGLEPMTPDQAASYLSAHSRLFVGISYLPNQITAQMVNEARARSKEPAVSQVLLDRYGYRV